MAYSLLDHNAAASANTTSVTSSSFNSTGASLLLVQVSLYSFLGDALLGYLTDSKVGNTWHINTSYETVANIECVLYWCLPTSVGAGHTVTWDSGLGTFPALVVSAWAGAYISPNDGGTGNNGGAGSTIQPGSLTPPFDNELLVSGVATGAGTIDSIDSGYTILDTVNFDPGVNIGISHAYKIQTSLGAENPTWTLSTSVDRSANAAQWHAAAVATKRFVMVP